MHCRTPEVTGKLTLPRPWRGSLAAKLVVNRDRYKALSCRTKALLMKDKERYARNFPEDVEGYLNTNDPRPVNRTLKKLHSKADSQVNAVP